MKTLKSSHPKMAVLAAVAHPDDIEFMMAGTLLLLKKAGAEIHMWNLANGCCGTSVLSRKKITEARWKEARDSAHLAGAVAHPPLFDDLEIFYDAKSLARVAAVVREIRPNMVLLHSPQDYMEDHQNSSRLLVSAVFARGMLNYNTIPPRPVYADSVTIYHALPHGLRDGLGHRVAAESFVDIGSVLEQKRLMLAQHRSQKEWLDASQGMDSYLQDMEKISREMGKMSGRFKYAEGWRRHLHLGFSPEKEDPLQKILSNKYHLNPKYQTSLESFQPL